MQDVHELAARLADAGVESLNGAEIRRVSRITHTTASHTLHDPCRIIAGGAVIDHFDLHVVFGGRLVENAGKCLAEKVGAIVSGNHH